MIKYLENNNLEEETKEGITLVDFYADWCGPCQMLTPILEELQGIKIIKVDIDKFGDLATTYGIMSIPTLIFFKDGKEVKKEIGFRNKEEIEEIINSIK